MSRQQALQSAPADPQQPHGDGHGPDLLTQVQVCARLGISDQSWMRWRKAGRTPEPVTLPSGRLKWRKQDIDRLAGTPQEVSGRRFFAAGSRHVATVTAFASGRPRKTVAKSVDGGSR